MSNTIRWVCRGAAPVALTAFGLPPLPGTPGFAERAPSYEFTVFEFATGAFIGTEHLLRPDIYDHGKPSCPQQPGGEYVYNSRNDLWFCLRT